MNMAKGGIAMERLRCRLGKYGTLSRSNDPSPSFFVSSKFNGYTLSKLLVVNPMVIFFFFFPKLCEMGSVPIKDPGMHA